MSTRYTPDGIPLEEEQMELSAVDRKLLNHIRGAIRIKMDLLTWRCGCRHEQRQKQFYEEGGDAADSRFELAVFCPREVRESYANCAHVESYGRDPDPFGSEIRSLILLGLLDESTWLEWLQSMHFAILRVDTTISNSLVKSDGRELVPLPQGVTPEDLQDENIAELRKKGTILIETIERTLSHATQ